MSFRVVYPELQRLCRLFLQSVRVKRQKEQEKEVEQEQREQREKLILINFSSDFDCATNGKSSYLTMKVIGVVKLLKNDNIYGLGTVKVKSVNQYYLYTGEWTNGDLTVYSLITNHFIFNGSKLITNTFERDVKIISRSGSNIEMFKDDIFKTTKTIYNNDVITHIPIKMGLYQSDESYLINFPVVLGAGYFLSTLFDSNYDIIVDLNNYNKIDYELDTKVDKFTLFNGFDISYLICSYNEKDHFITHIISKDKATIIHKNLSDNSIKQDQIKLTRGTY